MQWSPVKALQSYNNFRGFAVDLMGNNMVGLVFQMMSCGGRKARERWLVMTFSNLIKLRINGWFLTRKKRGLQWWWWHSHMRSDGGVMAVGSFNGGG